MYNRSCRGYFTIQSTFDSIGTTYFRRIHVDFGSYSYNFIRKMKASKSGIVEPVRKQGSSATNYQLLRIS